MWDIILKKKDFKRCAQKVVKSNLNVIVDFPLQVLYNIVALSVAIVINSNPILHLLCVYVLKEEPTTTDMLGNVLFDEI